MSVIFAMWIFCRARAWPLYKRSIWFEFWKKPLNIWILQKVVKYLNFTKNRLLFEFYKTVRHLNFTKPLEQNFSMKHKTTKNNLIKPSTWSALFTCDNRIHKVYVDYNYSKLGVSVFRFYVIKSKKAEFYAILWHYRAEK